MATAWNHLHVMFASKMHGHVLDAGCGNGAYSAYLAMQPGVTKVTSLDIQPETVPHHDILYRQLCQHGTFVQGDVQALPFPDDTFDCVLCWDMLQNVKDAPLAFREFHRVTRNGGLVTVRTVIRERTPWVVPGVTVEKGSSGFTFTCWTMWDPEDMAHEAELAGFMVLAQYIDPWNHQTAMLRTEK